MRLSSVDFSIITPSLNMLGYLKRCCASVADQKGASFEHIVVDGISTDGTVEWLGENEGVVSIVEADRGMYDAINKGLHLAKGEVLAYLNCDEQYLPETLGFVKRYFVDHPDVDVVFGDPLIVRPDGSLVSYRKGYRPRWFYILSSRLYLFSCTMFVRRKVIDEGLAFDPSLRVIGDQDFVIRALRYGYRVRHIRRYLAAFTRTGRNLGSDEAARSEAERALRDAPTWVRALRWPLNALRLTEKLVSGAYFQKMPLEYAIYVSANATERKTIRAASGTFRWPPR